MKLHQQKSFEVHHSISCASLPKKSSSILGIFSLGGQSSLKSTRNALAKQSSSKSETHRNCVSILASVSRLKSHPQRRQRAANIGCVNCCWSRNLRICGPTRFLGFFMFRFQNEKRRHEETLKGSEFRTTIVLAKLNAASENSPQRKMKIFRKEFVGWNPHPK